jgi:condensin complex subunit 3
VVRNGLGDREGAVKTAAGSLVGVWVDVVGDEDNDDPKSKNAKEGEGKGKEIQRDVVALLKLFDLAEGTIAEDALLSVFKNRVDIFDALEFDGQSLPPEILVFKLMPAV